MSDSSGKVQSEPVVDYAKQQNQAKPPYYIADLDSRISPQTKDLLEKYSHVPPGQQSAHVHTIRDQAWDIRAYPCIGLGAWLVPQLCHHPSYTEILRRIRDGGMLLDIGTFIGHDLRRLVVDGAPSARLYGIDIVDTFADVGYAFFRDRDHFCSHFITADFLSDTAPELVALKGQADVIVVSQLLHQWNWGGQLAGLTALSTFTKPGALVVGNQIGNARAQEAALLGSRFWRHDPDSFARMWRDVGQATDTTWETEAWLRTPEYLGLRSQDNAWMEPGNCFIEFVARRTS